MDHKNKYIKEKKDRREKKRTDKRSIEAEEVIFIFEKVLEEWRTIKIFNTMIQQNPSSLVDKKKVETIATGNCKVYPNELSEERHKYYCNLREKVYSHWNQKKSPHPPDNHSRQSEQSGSPESINDDRRESPVFQQGVTGGFVDTVNNKS